MGDTVATASPQQLLVMLYDRLALDLERGEAALRAGDHEESSRQLLHAQEIVTELQSSLKVDVWEGGPRLSALYTWLFTELIQANVKRDANRVASCRQIVEPLKDAWRQAAASLAVAPA
jgi:flagellar protein FliS